MAMVNGAMNIAGLVPGRDYALTSKSSDACARHSGLQTRPGEGH